MLNQITTNQNVQKAVSVIGRLSASDEAREIANKREEAILIYESIKGASKEEGREEGRAEGIAIGEERGIAKMIEALRKIGGSDEMIEAVLREAEDK